ncbi:CPBP family glutamic-type intramembrane protease [Paraburkholderia sp. JPY419]|uniref:CPBP family glutamic-type intramembrane protease n=1 Tax=Paraburkholderia sp. JPY419 TaxID=667660 RepID=UPI003D1EC6B0
MQTFRHFLLSALPFRANRRIAAIAVVATSLLFSVQHRHYAYLSTYLLLFALGIVFARARIRTGGVALPIALHSYAMAFALVCDQVVAHVRG